MKLCYERDPGSDKNAQDPLYLVAIVYEWSQLKLKGEGQVNMILSTPFHPQQKMVKQVNRNTVVSRLKVKFNHECPFSQARHQANNLINSNVMKSKLNPIVDTSPPWERQVHNEMPFSCLPFFRMTPKLLVFWRLRGNGNRTGLPPCPGKPRSLNTR